MSDFNKRPTYEVRQMYRSRHSGGLYSYEDQVEVYPSLEEAEVQAKQMLNDERCVKVKIRKFFTKYIERGES